MQRLVITGVCALALLSGCTERGVPVGDVPPPPLPCTGKDQKLADTHIRLDASPTPTPVQVRFVAPGPCKITKFIFVGNGHDPPPGFKQVTNPPSAAIIYEYDRKTPIPTAGYYFYYVNDDPQDGNGSGVVKN